MPRTTFLNISKFSVLGLLALILAACSTSEISTYSPSSKNVTAAKPKIVPTSKTAKTKNTRRSSTLARTADASNPWQAARERYNARMEEFHAKRKARLEELRAKREAQREKRRAAAEKRKAGRNATTSAKRKSTTSSRKNIASNSKKSTKRKTAKRNAAKRAKKSVARNKPSKNIAMARGIRARAPWKCLPGRLKVVMNSVAKRYGRLTINSTYRSPRHNRRVGGAKRSWHKKCAAVDFRVHGPHRGLSRFLRNHRYVGGLKRYRSGYYHIDIGPRRSW